jgi:DNA-binding transcriptional MerR regulator
MGGYSIGEVEGILGVKDYVIRYWEREIPMLAPRKGLSGRREYGERDIAVLIRARHLIQDRRFTLDGAREALMSELSGPGQNARALIAELRGDLVRLYLGMQKRANEKTTNEG